VVELEAKCNPVAPMDVWMGHDVTNLLSTVPPAKGPVAEAGFDPDFDKLYECILTVEPSWYGESVVNILAMDQAGSVSTDGISQVWYFNPAVILDLDTNDGAPAVMFEDNPLVSVPGSTVYSTNELVITNLAEGNVDLLVFIAADDLTDPTHTAAKCCWSNVLDVEGITCSNGETYNGMDYRCKIGTLMDNEWNDMTNKNTKEDCNGVVDLDPNDGAFGDSEVCYGAKGVLTEHLPVLMNMHKAECSFRLQYPVPCVGSFTEGLIHIIVRAL
jgi:hypothetical protein